LEGALIVQKGSNTSSTLLKGAAILGLAALISKVLGSIYKIPFQNIAGDGAYGIYSIVYPIYILILFAATAGLPITVSKLVSERLVEHDYIGAKRIFRLSAIVMSLTGLILFLFLYFGAEWIAYLTGDSQTALSIRSVSFALLVVPVMAAMRGYFQGHQNMVPTGVSQVYEQIVRVATMLTITYWFVQIDWSGSGWSKDAWTAAGATFGAVSGSIAGLGVMMYYWWRQRKSLENNQSGHLDGNKSEFATMSNRRLMKIIFALALPILLGSIVLPILNIVDTFTLPRLLQWGAELSEDQAREWLSYYYRGLPLVQFVAMFASSLAVALVPSIAEAYARKQQDAIMLRTHLALRLTLLIGLPASVGLAILAEPINIMLFKTNDGTLAMAILAFTTLFSTLNIISSAILQGLGAVFIPAKNLLVAAITKAVLNIALIGPLGIEGAAIASVTAFAVATVLNLIAIQRLTGVSFSFLSFVYKPMLSIVAMSTVLLSLMYGLNFLLTGLLGSVRLEQTVVSLSSVFVGAIVYGVALFRSGAVGRTDLESVPRLGKRLLPLLVRLKLLPLSEQKGV
jgi:PST family polysaccharide transporter